MTGSSVVGIRAARASDAPGLAAQLVHLGYPSDLGAVSGRLAVVLGSTAHHLLVAAAPDGSRIDGYLGLERRLTLHQDEHVEITDLVVDPTARRTGVGRALVAAGESWAARLGLDTVVVRSNVVRPESHGFYEGVGYRRTATSHLYRKQVRALREQV